MQQRCAVTGLTMGNRSRPRQTANAPHVTTVDPTAGSSCKWSGSAVPASANPHFLYNPERGQHRGREQEADQDQPYPSLAAEISPASLAASRSKRGADRYRLLRAGRRTHRPIGRMAALSVDRLGMAQDRIEPLGRRRTRCELLTSPPQARRARHSLTRKVAGGE
jgi:hypothetical protein